MRVDWDSCVAEVLETPGMVEMEVAHYYGFDVLYGVTCCGDGGFKFMFGTVVYTGEDVV